MNMLGRFLMMAALLALPQLAEASDLKIGVVDMQTAVKATKHYKDALAAVKKERTERQAVLEAQKVTLGEKKQQLDAQKAVSDPSKSVEAEEKLEIEKQKLARAFMQFQQELIGFEKRLTEQLLGRMEVVVREVAATNGYTYIMERGEESDFNVLYAKPNLDITKKVISTYQKRFGKKALNLQIQRTPKK